MPPVQEEMSLLQSRSLSHSPAFSKCVDGDAYDADASVEMTSTAEECKEILDRSKHQSFPMFMNNNGRIYDNNNNNRGDMNNNNNEDEDDCWNLTSLEWLQDKNLLRKVIGDPYSGSGKLGMGFLSTSPTPSEEGRSTRCNSSNCQFVTPKVECTSDAEGDFEPLMPSAYHPTRHADCKPPYSFSCLIFMAIENSPDKRLPVKDIYAWIQDNFPFFGRAPSGWKNSVRHNLSLNKCFTKVEKDKGAVIGKGSYWCVDPTYKANLLQALRKTPYQPFHQMQMVSSNHVAAPFGIPLAAEGTDARPNANITSLFPYTSKKQQSKPNACAAAATDSSEIDVANALVSLRKSATSWNAAGCFRADDIAECSDYEDDDEWVDEVVDDDDEEEEEEDEEMVTAQMVQMLKRKLGEQRLKDLSCTPAASSDHQYGMSDDRVRDILTRYDCFDEGDSCSVSEESDGGESDDAADDRTGRNGVDVPEQTGDGYDPTTTGERMELVEIKQEIKEEVVSGDDEDVSTFPVLSMNFTPRALTLNKSGTKSGRKQKPRASLPKPSVGKAPVLARVMTGRGRKRKRRLDDEFDDGSIFDDEGQREHDRHWVPTTRKQSKRKVGAKRRKEVNDEEEEEQQRIREGVDALLELATVAAANEQMVDDRESSSDSFAIQKDTPAATKKQGRRGRPPNPKNLKKNTSKSAINSRSSDAVKVSSRKIDYDLFGKKRLPRDFVPNGLKSVGSGVPRLFQSKRLQMKYLEQAVSSNDEEDDGRGIQGTAGRQVENSKKSCYPSKKGNRTQSRSASSVEENEQQPEGLEEMDSKDWSINFSSVDLSEMGSSEPGKREVLYDLQGKKMVVIGEVKKEPCEEEVEIKIEVEDVVDRA